MRHYTEDKKRAAIDLSFDGDLTSQQVVDRAWLSNKTMPEEMATQRQMLR
jgi:hypothetical protein